MERGRLEVLRIAALPANADSSDPAYASAIGFGKLTPADKHSINGPDNITITPLGEMLGAEDAGNLELSVLRDDGTSQPAMRLFGHDASEITGPAVSPDGLRLYFSSQRGTTGNSEDGITYEILLPTKLVI